MAVSAPVHRWTIDRVLAMVEAGVLEPGAHLELIDGVLFEMTPQGMPHMLSVHRCAKRLRAAYMAMPVEVFEEKCLAIGTDSLPEPDVFVYPSADLRDADRFEAHRAVLVVEVSYTSQRVDRDKAALYARGGVATYWRVDLRAGHVVAYTDPSPEGYGRMRTWRAGESLPVPTTGDELAVDDLLG
jgi:Uma2 family endonuclease